MPSGKAKQCTNCDERLAVERFHHYGADRKIIGKWCESCYQKLQGRRLERRRHYDAKRRSTKRNARPKGTNVAAINEIYRLARLVSKITGHPHHVAHAIPLAGTHVCGLDVPANLRVKPANSNIREGRRFGQRDAARAEKEMRAALDKAGLV